MQECMELCKEMFTALERGNFIRIKENMDIEYYRCIDRLLSMNVVISYKNFITINPENADYVEYEIKNISLSNITNSLKDIPFGEDSDHIGICLKNLIKYDIVFEEQSYFYITPKHFQLLDEHFKDLRLTLS